MTSKLNEESYNAGVITTLAIIAQFDARTIFDEVVKSVGAEALVKTARRTGAMRWSGLTRYGYGRQFPS